MIEYEFLDSLEEIEEMRCRLIVVYKEHLKLLKQLEVDGKMLKIVFPDKEEAKKFQSFLHGETCNRMCGLKENETFYTSIVKSDKKNPNSKFNMYIARVNKD